MYTPCPGYMFIYKELYLYNRGHFELSTFWTARVCVASVCFHVLLLSEIEFRWRLPCCSPDTQSLETLSRRVLGEQQGGAAEILSWIGGGHGNEHKLHILGWDGLSCT